MQAAASNGTNFIIIIEHFKLSNVTEIPYTLQAIVVRHCPACMA
jgi:hypothetical protein